jgi:hypothetical protein
MDTWSQISRLRGTTLKTLDQKHPFDIVEVTPEAVTVRPHATDKERAIRRAEIEPAFQELVTKGVLTRTEIHKQYSEFNPAYVAAILAALPDVQHSVRPIELKYHPQQAAR